MIRPTWFVTCALAAALGIVGCNADVEEGCLSGPCGPDAQASVESTSTSTTAATGSGGGAPATVCVDAGDQGDLPCEVLAILNQNCQCCHQSPEPKNGAPFPLMRWEDTQAMYGAVPVWEAMKTAINLDPKFMPLQGSLTQTEKDTLNAWLDGGALPDETSPDSCECLAEASTPPAACIMD